MATANQQLVLSLVDIIKNFRTGELQVAIDSTHVNKWISQFDESVEDIILQETINLLGKFYANREKLTDYINRISSFVKNELAYDLDDVTFWNGQSNGKSQTLLLDILRQSMPESVHIDCKCRKHIVYIDDGLFTGSTVRKTIERIVRESHQIESLDIFHYIAYSNGLEYTQCFLKKICNQNGIQVSMHRLVEVENRKATDYSDNSETYHTNLGVLWPSSNLSSFQKVQEFIGYVERTKKMHLKYKTHSDLLNSTFLSVTSREVLEKEFLLKGLDFLPKGSIDKGIYPLGYDVTPSFGFGSFWATDYNISNNCPVVLWWDASEKWYPLLPRKITNDDESPVWEMA